MLLEVLAFQAVLVVPACLGDQVFLEALVHPVDQGRRLSLLIPADLEVRVVPFLVVLVVQVVLVLWDPQGPLDLFLLEDRVVLGVLERQLD